MRTRGRITPPERAAQRHDGHGRPPTKQRQRASEEEVAPSSLPPEPLAGVAAEASTAQRDDELTRLREDNVRLREDNVRLREEVIRQRDEIAQLREQSVLPGAVSDVLPEMLPSTPPSAATTFSAAPSAGASPTPPSDLGSVVAELSHRFVRGASRAFTTFTWQAPAVSQVTLRATPLPEATRQLLTTLDDRLIEALKKGDIRLVRAAWLLAQPADFHMINRQALEKMDGALLPPQEAANAIRAGTRSIGVLSHGWLSPVRRGRGRKHASRPLPRPDAPSPPHAVR